MKNIENYDLPRGEWEKLIDDWIFSSVYRQMLKDRLLDGVCFEALAKKHGYSVQHTKSIIYKSMEKLIKHIK
ncbi:MAG: hypothetical protein IJ366_00315 [Clostridia bacterium]|nr:hypothetical protein [Clostridia bacterium]